MTSFENHLMSARKGQALWAQMTLDQRLEMIERFGQSIAAEMDVGVQLLHQELGKPHLEALAGDLWMVLEFIRYSRKVSGRALQRRKIPGSILWFGRTRFYEDYYPCGVVLVVGPWNYPLQLGLIPALTALVAGNAVILKPSEIVPKLSNWLRKMIENAGFPKDVFQVVEGGPSVVHSLVEAKPDRIFVTGSTATGKAIAKMAAENLIPVDLELGGKDAMVIFPDAHLERAAKAAAYGAFMNAGQVCVGVKRIYVHRSIEAEFLELFKSEVKQIRVGLKPDSDMGPMARGLEVSTILSQLSQALGEGAKLETPQRVEDRLVFPLVITGLSDESRLIQEESFGPIVGVLTFESESEVVSRVNRHEFGLSASVWSRDLKRAEGVASQLIVGSCCINEVVKTIVNLAAPFGGEKLSGHGRYHGEEGFRSMSRRRTVLVNSGKALTERNWFPYSAVKFQQLKAIVQYRSRLISVFELIRKMI